MTETHLRSAASDASTVNPGPQAPFSFGTAANITPMLLMSLPAWQISLSPIRMPLSARRQALRELGRYPESEVQQNPVHAESPLSCHERPKVPLEFRLEAP